MAQRDFPLKKDAAASLGDGLMETLAQAVATALDSRKSIWVRLDSPIAA